jgi:hypothetical protein
MGDGRRSVGGRSLAGGGVAFGVDQDHVVGADRGFHAVADDPRQAGGRGGDADLFQPVAAEGEVLDDLFVAVCGAISCRQPSLVQGNFGEL